MARHVGQIFVTSDKYWKLTDLVEIVKTISKFRVTAKNAWKWFVSTGKRCWKMVSVWIVILFRHYQVMASHVTILNVPSLNWNKMMAHAWNVHLIQNPKWDCFACPNFVITSKNWLKTDHVKLVSHIRVQVTMDENVFPQSALHKRNKWSMAHVDNVQHLKGHREMVKYADQIYARIRIRK